MSMAPGGIEPPHAASKAAALSAELRGRASRRVSGGLRGDGRAELALQVREVRPRIDRRAGRVAKQLLRDPPASLRVDLLAQPVAQRPELAALDLLVESA